MVDFVNGDGILNGSVFTLTGTGDPDTFTISGNFASGGGGTTGLIEGLGGDDTLISSNANLINTSFSSIEFTQLTGTSATIDAAQIGNLGAISFSGTSGVSVSLSNGNGQTADFSGLTLEDGQELTVTTTGISTGNTLTVDFSAATFNGTGFIDFNGGNANETVTGGSGNDELDGNSGDDVLSGAGGDDLILGGTGNNTLFGGAGMDTLRADTASSGLIDGGAEDDLIQIVSTFQNSSIQGGANTDTLELGSSNLSGTDFGGIETTLLINTSAKTIDAEEIANLGAISFSGISSTTITLSNGNGQTADFSGLTLADGQELTVNTTGISSGDTLTVDFSSGTLTGTGFIDFNGGSASETVTGGSGDDEIDGNNGDDVLSGADGDDLIIGGTGNNTLFGGAGTDTLRADSSSSGLIDGGTEDDLIEIVSTFQNSSIQGGANTDTLELGSSNLSGTDFGGIETTLLINTAAKTIDAEEIADLGAISFSGVSSSTITLSNGNGQTADFSNLTLADGEELTVNTTGITTGDALTVDFSSGTFNGTSFIDFNGANADETVTGGSSNDEFDGNNGNDALSGGGGNDFIQGGAGTNSLFGGAGTDTLRADGASDGLIDGGVENDLIQIVSTYQNASIQGGSGTDDLELNSTNMSGTTVGGIEATRLINTAIKTIDAAQIANLGTITTEQSNTSVTLSNGNGETANFSGLVLDDGDELTVSTTGISTGNAITVDFSAGTFNGTGFIDFDGVNANDTVFGGSGNDQLDGNNGDDNLLGGLGADLIIGGAGNNSLFGGIGTDTLTADAASSGLLDGGSENDSIRVVSTFQNSSIQGGSGTDALEISSSNMSGTTIGGIEATSLINTAAKTIDAAQIINLGTITAAQDSSSITLSNGNGQTADFQNLSLTGSQELTVNTIGLTAGNTITVDFSAASFLDSSFIDFNGGSASETVRGGAGNDEISGGSTGADQLFGGIGEDTITQFAGGAGIFGGTGADTLISSSAVDGVTIDGGSEDDQIELLSTFTNGTVDGGTGSDNLVIRGNTTGTDFEGITSTQLDNNATKTIDSAEIGDLGLLTLSGSAITFGGSLTLANSGGQLANFGGLLLENNQTLTVDTTGQIANQTATVDFSGATFNGNSSIRYTGAAANDVVSGGSGADSINGAAGDDILTGNGGADTLIGGGGDNSLFGGAGEDFLSANTSSSGVLDGGANNDTIRVFTGFQSSSIQGGGGDDTLELLSADLTGTDIGGIEQTFFDNNGGMSVDAEEIVNLGAISLRSSASSIRGTLNATNSAGQSVDLSGLTLSGSENFTINVNALNASQSVSFDLSGASIATSAEVDYNGTAGSDTYQGGSGIDIVTGLGGNDSLSGGAGNDSINGGDNDDILEGEQGNDTLVGGSGNNSLFGGIGNDTLNSNTNSSGLLDGGGDNDLIDIFLTFQSSSIQGGDGTDILELNSANLTGTTIGGIEQTQLANNGTMTIDASQVVNLGAISLTNSAGTISGNFTFSNAAGQSVDLSNLTLAASQNLDITTSGASSGDGFTVDLSGGTFGPSAQIDFFGGQQDDTYIASSATDDVRGNAGSDTISYQASSAAVNVDLGAQTVSGGDADGDTISSIENVIGSAQGDEVRTSSADNTFFGGDGQDIFIVNGNAEDYEVQTDGATTVVTDLVAAGGNDGTDTLVGVEILRFNDADLAIGVIETPTVSITANQVSLDEGDSGTTDFSFLVRRLGEPAALALTSSVDFTVAPVAGVLAAEASDFIGSAFPSGTVNFAADQTAATITVQVAGDVLFESDEAFNVTLSNPVDAVIGTETASSTITNDDDSETPLEVIDALDPGNSNQIVAIGFDPISQEVARYFSFASVIQILNLDGDLLREIPHPSEGSNDIDLTFAPEALTLGTTNVPAGSLLVINGESGTADIQAIDPADGALIASLTTDVGAGSIVGGAYSGARDTFFLVNFSTDEIVEIDPTTGTTISSFDTGDFGFNFNFGDIEIDPVTGDILGVSSQESQLIRISPDGDLIDLVDLPDGVNGLSGLAPIDGDEALVSSTAGRIFRLGFFDAVPRLEITSSQASRAEGDAGSAVFTFTVTRFGDRSEASSVEFTVETVAGIEDAEADDFTGGAFPSGLVEFAADQRTQTITINVAGDTQVESDEMFRVVLSDPTGAIITQPSVVSQINNDDVSTTPLSEIFRFNPEDLGQLVAVAFDPGSEEIAVYSSFASVIVIFDTEGNVLRSIPHPSEGSNDIDLEFAPEALTLNGTEVPAGSLLVINGETGTADIQAIDPSDGTVLATLTTEAGNGSIVGGAYNPATNTFFLIDFSSDLLLEVSPADGTILATIDVGELGYSINFGDIDFDPVTGDFLLVSSQESTVLRLSPDFELLDEVPLPNEVTSLSGIATVDGRDFYVTSTLGNVHLLGFFDPATFPVAADDTLTTDEDTAVSSNLITGDADGNGEDTDPEDDDLILIDVRDSFGRLIAFDTATSTGSGGQVTVSENGDITFNPNNQFNQLDETEEATQTLTYTVSDGKGGTDTATVNITITGVNDIPDVIDPGIRFVAENTTFVADLVAVDPDDTDLVFSIEEGGDGALFEIDSATGVLSFSEAPDFEMPGDADNDNEYTLIVGASDGLLTGTETVTVRVTNVVEQRTLSIADASAAEGDSGETAITFTISLDAPAESDVSFDATVRNISTNAADFATGTQIGTPQRLTIASGESSTTFTVNVQGDTVVEADETFTVSLSSITGALAGDTLAVGTIVNDDEAQIVLAQDDAFETDEDTVLNEDLFANNGNGPDTGNVEFTVTQVRDSEDNLIPIGTQTAISGGGLLTVDADGSVIFDPNDEFEALGFNPNSEPPADLLSFTYTISNQDGSAISEANVEIGIRGINDEPIAVDDSATVGFEGSVDITVLENDLDPDDVELTVARLIEPEGFPGTLTLNEDGTVTYAAADGFAGDAVFQYEVQDEQGLRDTGSVTVSVSGPDARSIEIGDVRQSEGDTGTTDFIFTLTRSGDLRAVDMVRAVTQAGTALAGGDFLVLDEVVTFAANQNSATVTVQVIGDADIEIDETFTVALSNAGVFDNLTLPEAATGTILNDDVPGNTPPEVSEIEATFTEDDEDREVDLLDPELISDADEDPITIGDFDVRTSDEREILFSIEGGIFSLSNGQFDDLNIGDSVDIIVDYEVSDSNVLVPNTATITITGLNDAPLARPYDVELREDDEELIVDLLDPEFVSDVDNPLSDLSVTELTCCPDQGTDILIERDIRFTWDREGGRTIFEPGQFEDLAGGEELVFDLQYKIFDGVDETENVVTVTILGENDDPDVLAIDAEFGEDDRALAIDLLDPEAVSDPDALDTLQVGDLTCCFVTGTNDRLTREIDTELDRETGTLSIDPGQFEDLEEGEELIFDIQYEVSDATVTVLNTVTVTITGVNDAPDILSEDAFTVAENSTDVGQVEAADDEDDDLTFNILQDRQDGALFRIDGAGFISFVDAPDFEAPGDGDADNIYDLTVEVFDGRDTTTQSISVTVTDVDEGEGITIEGTDGSDVLVGSDQDETFVSLGGPVDVSTGGGGQDIFAFGAETSNGIREFDYITDFGQDDLLDIGDATIVREVISPTQTILLLSGDFDTIFLLGVDGFDQNQLV